VRAYSIHNLKVWSKQSIYIYRHRWRHCTTNPA